MRNFFLKINKKVFSEFRYSVSTSFDSFYRKTDSVLLKSVLKEVNNLISKISGRQSNKSDIPKPDDYPDSSRVNKLLTDIVTDLDKIYEAQTIVDDNVRQVMLFNSSQREKSLNNLYSVQGKVYNAYVKSNKILNGSTVIPAKNPFTSTDAITGQSSDVVIDPIRSTLTLSKRKSEQLKDIDINNVRVINSSSVPDEVNLYPSTSELAIGSHWMKEKKDRNFIDKDDPVESDSYRQRMIDSETNNMSIGSCEFESVFTSSKNKNIPEILKIELGKELGKDSNLIYLDEVNSSQSRYTTKTISVPDIKWNKFKLIIPFLETAPINELVITFSPDSNGNVPNINWEDSRIYAKNDNSEHIVTFIKPNTSDNFGKSDGEYRMITRKTIIPKRAEIVIEMDANAWIPLSFYMSYLSYQETQTYDLTTFSSVNGQSVIGKVKLVFNKKFDIFVDSRPPLSKEGEDKDKAAARAVLNSIVGT